MDSFSVLIGGGDRFLEYGSRTLDLEAALEEAFDELT